MDFVNFLKTERLFSYDPYDQEGLFPLQIKGSLNASSLLLENSYRAKDKIFCHSCGSAKHKNGFTCIDGDGDKVLLGSTCVKKHFSENVVRLAKNVYKLKVEIADRKYRYEKIRSSLYLLYVWCKNYGHLIRSLEDTWRTVFNGHEREFRPLLKALLQDDGRLVLRSGSTFAPRDQRGNQQILTRILATYRNYIGINYIEDMTKNYNSIDQFCRQHHSFAGIPSDDAIKRFVSNFESKLTRCAEQLDHAIAFSCEFLTASNMKIVCTHLDDLRNNRLYWQQRSVSPRNLNKILNAEIPFGFEVPRTKISDEMGDLKSKIQNVMQKGAIAKKG